MRWEGPKTPTALMAIVVASAAFVALFLSLVGPLHYEDIGDQVIYSAQVTMRAILEGRLPYWNASVGIGSPITHPQDLAFHPLAAGFLVIPIGAMLVIFQVSHLVLAQVYTIRVLRHLGMSERTIALALITYTLSEPAKHYLLTNSWPSLTVGWSFIPVMFFYLMRLVDASHAASRARDLALLVLATALSYQNSHAGLSVGNLLGLGIFGASEAFAHRLGRRQWLQLVAAGVLFAAIVGEKLVALLGELGRTPPDLIRTEKNYFATFYTEVIWHWTIRPFVLGDLGTLPDTWAAGGLGSVAAYWLREFGTRNADWQGFAPYIGVPFALLAFYAALSRSVRIRHKTGLVVLAAVCIVLLPFPSRALGPLGVIITGTGSFRDVLVFSGLLLASGAFVHLERAAPLRLSREIALIQVITLIVAAVPLVYFLIDKGQYVEVIRRPVLTLERHILVDPMEERLLRDRIGPDARVYQFASPLVASQLYHAGLSVVSVGLKGVMSDQLWPSPLKVYSSIGEDERVARHGPLLDVLGIRYVLTSAASARPPGLDEVARFVHAGEEVVVLANHDAWPAAVFISDEARTLRLPRRSDCPNDRFFCADLSAVPPLRQEGTIVATEDHGDFTFAFDPAPTRRLILVTQQFRPEWTATCDGARCAVVRAVEELVGIDAPAGTREVRLEYRPPARVAARLLGGTALGVTLALLLAAWRGRANRTVAA